MAERSKAPDSRVSLHPSDGRDFWSSIEGVGSNPTPDNSLLNALSLEHLSGMAANIAYFFN